MSDAAQSPAPGPGGPYLLPPSPSPHEARSRQLIVAAAAAAQPGRCIVLGGGNCADIPLAELAARFEHVTLNDVDRALLEKGIAAANVDEADRAKLDVQIFDLTGVTDSLVERIDQVLAGAADADEGIERMAQLLDDETARPPAIPGKYDLVIASCVLSQLNFGLTQRACERFEARFAGQLERLRQSPRWTASLYQMARRMEARFMDTLAALVQQPGLIYLSASPQMCPIKLTASGQWETEGTFRLLHSKDITDYVDRRFAIIEHGRWHWVVSPPAEVGQSGRLFDVQAFVLRLWRRDPPEAPAAASPGG